MSHSKYDTAGELFSLLHGSFFCMAFSEILSKKETLGNACLERLPMLHQESSSLNSLRFPFGVETNQVRLAVAKFECLKACASRSGLKRRCGAKSNRKLSRLNGYWDPFGVEKRKAHNRSKSLLW